MTRYQYMAFIAAGLFFISEFLPYTDGYDGGSYSFYEINNILRISTVLGPALFIYGGYKNHHALLVGFGSIILFPVILFPLLIGFPLLWPGVLAKAMSAILAIYAGFKMYESQRPKVTSRQQLNWNWKLTLLFLTSVGVAIAVAILVRPYL